MSQEMIPYEDRAHSIGQLANSYAGAMGDEPLAL
jgi:hypothetical protein